jgi:hypothetical protein
MIKLLDILHENKILVPRRSTEERQKNYLIATEKRIQQYIKDGSKGNLDLKNTPIQSLGNLISVGGDLDLRETQIKSLGNLQAVWGHLDLEGTSIESLGNLQSVGGYLNFGHTPIESLGNLQSVGGNVFLRGTPLSEKYTEEEIRQMVDVKGDIYL